MARELDRITAGVLSIFRPQRVVSVMESGHLEGYGVDLLGQMRDSALNRRVNRDNTDVVATYAAVFAAIRWREQAITRPQIVLQQRQGGKWVERGTTDSPLEHPALAALTRVNESTTYKQGFGGIERGKLTNGDHLWVMRRSGLGVPMEFEVWWGHNTRAYPRKDKPWVPAYFERTLPDGRKQQVDPKDAIWFRHIVDPRDPMRSLTPIGAIRVQADSAFEAQRYQQRYFDNGLPAGGILTPQEGDGTLGQAEVARISDLINNDWKGSDNAHRWHVLEANLKMLMTPQTFVDLQFAETLKWGVMETARAFEMSPITLKDFERATYQNADQAAAQDWETVRNQLDATVEEFNEFYVRPNFGDDYRFVARYAGIGPLQDALKAAAEVDEIRLRSAYTWVNELRQRDGVEPVAWGDKPIVPSNMLPLGEAPALNTPPPDTDTGNEPGRADMRTILELIDRSEAEGWTKRDLKNQVRKTVGQKAGRKTVKTIKWNEDRLPEEVVEVELA